jgi:hypothetical protein
VIAPPDTQAREIRGDAGFGARVVSVDIPKVMAPGRPHSCRLRVENAGERGWLPYYPELQARVALAIFVDGTRIRTFDVPQNIHRGERWHIAFEVTPPAGVGRFELRVRLLGEHQNFSERLGPLVLSETDRRRGTAPIAAGARIVSSQGSCRHRDEIGVIPFLLAIS